MTLNTYVNNVQLVPRRPSSLPELRAADEGVASAMEDVLSANTRRVYGTQWRLFGDRCAQLGLGSLPAEPLTVVRYLAARAGNGASIATLRLAASAIANAHEWAGHDSPCRDQGVRDRSRAGGRRLAKPQRQAGALTVECAGSHPTHRFTAPSAGPGPRNSPAGRRPRQVRPGPGIRPLRRGPAPERNGGVDLG